MSRSFITTMAMAIAVAGLASCGGAKSGSGSRPEAGILDGGLVVRPSALYFVDMDNNADFQVDMAEFKSGTTAAFAAADANGSGFLTPIELADWSETLAGDRYAPPGFMGFDTDGDQKITGEEFAATLAGLFKQFDRNDDNTVSRQEMVERLQRLRSGGARAQPRQVYGQSPRHRRR